ncbi:MAG: L,D-transpeptidase [Hyphomicrobiaceae bacterium]
MLRIILLATIPFVLMVSDAQAQGWSWFDDDRDSYQPYRRSHEYRRRHYEPRRQYRALPPARYLRSYDDDRDDDYRYNRRSRYGSDDRALPRIMNGGARPDITPIPPRRIAYRSDYAPGTIIIDTAGRQLLLVQSGGSALRYPISVGRQGFAWTGKEKISRIAAWPDWYPPAEMRERDPRLPEKMTGGLRNPLGAKALYLGNTLYRIHGTNDAKSIGRAQSSGCFRMLNGHVLDLARRVKVGTPVIISRNLRSAEAEGGKSG